MKKKLKELKAGDFFTLKDYGENPDESRVYVRGDYDKSERKYEIYKFSDCNAFRFMPGTKEVYTGFTF